MRLVTFEASGLSLQAGVLTGAGVVPLGRSVRELLSGDPAELEKARQIAGMVDATVVTQYQLRAPIPDPPKIVCIGLNYKDHAAESNSPIPEEPVVFSKFTTTIIGPGDTIRLPKVSEEVDYEAELVVVIGSQGRYLSPGQGMDHVFGYTIGHDVSARDWQRNKGGKQWLMGKSFDTFAPIGPAIVSKDEVPDPDALGVRLRLNGNTMQDSTTSQMIFKVGYLVEYLSQIWTLEPGDLIFTGTPPGVGFARKPPVWLKSGDRVEVEIDGLGVLSNTCVAD